MAMGVSKTPGKQSLSDLSGECFMLIVQLRSAKSIDDPAQLRERTKAVLDRFDRGARDAGVEREDIENAKFALVAFIDEAITGVNFSQKDAWLANPLQMELFGRYDAGEEFFKRLGELRQRAQVYAHVLEIYCMCLMLGYKGKYAYQETAALRGLVDDTKSDLRRVKDGGRTVMALSPHGKPEDRLTDVVYRDIPTWVIGASAAALCVLFFLIMSWFMTGSADAVKNIIESVG